MLAMVPLLISISDLINLIMELKLPNATHLPSRSRSIQICILQSMLIMIKMRIVDSILWSIITRIFSVIIMSRNRFSSWE